MSLLSLHDIGAKRFLGLDELTDRQRKAAEEVLREVRKLAEKVQSELTEDRQRFERDLVYRHPRYVFVIDGNRGSGKTTLLLTLHHFLTHLSGGSAVADKKTARSLEDLGLLEPTKANPMPPLVLPILNPNEMERADDTMENIFAQITTYLRDSRSGEGLSKTLAAACAALEDRLHGEVALGWSFSRDVGVDTLSRDSLDFKDFVKQRAEQATRSYTRQQSWRKFVNEFLDQFSRQLLIICIDDTDLAPSVTDSILHAIRMYLSHPRIVVLLCTNLKYIRHTLELRALERISVAFECLSAEEAEEARRQERQITEEYLYKILPPDLHLRLSMVEGDLNVLYQDSVLGRDPAENWKAALQKRTMERWNEGDIAGARGWRLFYDRDGEILTSLPLREVCEFMRLFQYKERTVSEILDEKIRRGPSFSRLLRRLHEVNIARLDSLLERQDLNISWAPSPAISIAGMKYRKEDPEFRVVEWLIDYAIVSNPLSSQSTFRWLPRLLPQLPPWESSTLEEAWGKERIGLSAYFPNSSVPRSCLYFQELIRIADLLLGPHPPEPRVLQGHWGEDFKRVLLNNDTLLMPDDIAEELRQDTPNTREIVRKLASFFSDRSSEPTPQPCDRLPTLWLLFHLSRPEESLGEQSCLSHLRSWADLRSRSSEVEETSELQNAFAGFLVLTQRWLWVRLYAEYRRHQMLVCALRLIGKAGLNTSPIIKNLREALESAEIRGGVLLLWSLAESLPGWLTRGIERSDIEEFDKLPAIVASLWERFQESRKADAFDFLDLPPEAQERISQDLKAARERLEEALRNRESIIVPDLAVDPFTLNREEQIAYILRISPEAARQLGESVRG